MVQCVICNKSFKYNKGLALHLKYTHGISYINYSIQYNRFKIPACCICGKSAEYSGNGLKFRKTCGKDTCKKAQYTNRVHSDETKEKIRKNTFERFKKRLGDTAWERRNAGKMSYMEQWFFDNAIVRYGLLTKFDIINEYPDYPYFIDFAFLNVKIAVELDGKQHFRNIKNQNHDLKKQQKLIDNGWKVYRIRFDEMNSDKISDFLKIIDNPSIYHTKILEPRLFKFYSSKKIDSDKRCRKLEATLLKKEQDNIKKVKNSNIDFSRFGWVTQVSMLMYKKLIVG
jgi:very-short-patch-repair endonuclease